MSVEAIAAVYGQMARGASQVTRLAIVPALLAWSCVLASCGGQSQAASGVAPTQGQASVTRAVGQPAVSPASAPSTAQSPLSQSVPPIAREFRGLWVATVANIDWPSKRELTVAQQQEEMRAILDKASASHFNAIVLQVRPTCDAIYPSELEPWSEFLTGKQGKAPEPMYDPLEMWIAGAHARGMELHAWINPYRARHIETKGVEAPSHVVNAKPGLVRKYDRYHWLDPSEKSAQDHTMAVVLDLVRRYDIDGIHMDDYFYPYPKDKVDFPDEPNWKAYVAGGGKLSREDWRRSKIDGLMSRLYSEVKAAKPSVKVGISPFGIWRPGFPASVKGFDAYDKLYADSRKWLMEGWCDYLSPQLYWRRDAKEQGFEELLRWWLAQNPKGRHVWPGLYTSKIPAAGSKPASTDAAKKAAFDADEILGQIDITRRAAGSGDVRPGVVHFSAVALLQNRDRISDRLKDSAYVDAALVPAVPWSAAKGASGGAAKLTAPGQLGVLGGPDAKATVRWVSSASVSDAAGLPRWWAVQVKKRSGTWSTLVVPGTARSGTIDCRASEVEAVAVTGVDRLGGLGERAVVAGGAAK